MTTGENTDNDIERVENLTVTSDAAFERVTNDIKMEEDGDKGYLQQNTAGLVQEIPNISFLDIADTFLETKKTLADKAGYVLVVGQNGKSIEATQLDSNSLRVYYGTKEIKVWVDGTTPTMQATTGTYIGLGGKVACNGYLKIPVGNDLYFS